MSGSRERERRREQRLAEEQAGSGAGRRRLLLQIASAATFLAVAAVLVLIVVNGTQTSGGDTELEDTALVSHQLAGIPQQGMTLGRAQAKVTLVEFGDLQCPVCKAFSEEILPPLIDSQVRSGEAKIEFRNFVIIGQESVPAGAAAIAAGEQGRAWNFVELFYRNQGIEHSGYIDDEFLTQIARGAGVEDIGRWDRERRSARVRRLVAGTTSEAGRLGFEGTPSFAIEGPATAGLEALGTPATIGDLESAITAAR